MRSRRERAPARPQTLHRLRAKAARVQAAIDRVNARVESLVEDHNQVREALARTRVEQARTRRQVLAARAGASWAGSGGAGAPSGAAGRAVSFVRSQLGKPYVRGAAGPMIEAPCSGASVRVASIGRGDDIGAVRPTG